MDLNDPMNNTMIDENNENTENTENNIINDEIVFEENTELSSEEYVIENKSVDEPNNENTFSWIALSDPKEKPNSPIKNKY